MTRLSATPLGPSHCPLSVNLGQRGFHGHALQVWSCALEGTSEAHLSPGRRRPFRTAAGEGAPRGG